eukprot:5718798-Prymnesium_polylepis.1
MASSPRRPSHHGETACLQVGPLPFHDHPSMQIARRRKRPAGIRTHSRQPSHCAVDEPNHEATRDSSAQRPIKAHYIRSV